MKATIRDPIVLHAVSPLELAGYLSSSGWREAQRIGDKGAVWVCSPQRGKEYEILVPLRTDLGDYIYRIADALHTLEVIEQRSPLEIFFDLTTADADVIRVRVTAPDTAAGTIPLEDGVGLVQHAREMLLAAACAAIQPKSRFPARKPVQAMEYLEHVRLGQTERGSYGITLLSRVPPELEPDKNGLRALDVEEPFPRRATLTLARALATLQRATQQTATARKLSAFENAVSAGVSANLCEAISAMARGGIGGRGLEVSLTWSPARAVDAREPGRFVLSPDAIIVIGEAGRMFREISPQDDVELLGFVTRLDRDPGQPGGRVTVHAFLEEGPRKVHVDLTEPEYPLAVKAYSDRRLVRCFGQLVKIGQMLSLQQPHRLELVEEE